MLIKTAYQFVAKTASNLPLKTVLTVPFVLQIVGAVGLTGWLSFRNGQQAVDNVAIQLQMEITDRIKDRLDTYLATPDLIVKTNEAAISQGLLNPDDPQVMGRYFWQQIQFFEHINFISYSNRQGEYIAATRSLDDGRLQLILANQSTNNALNTYAVDIQGNRTKLLKSGQQFDPRQQIWYQKAVKAGQEVWYPIYKYIAYNSLKIGIASPVYDQNGKLRGVLTADLALEQIGKFLHSLKIGRTGRAFIIRPDGQLVAASSVEQQLNTKIIQATESKDFLVKSAAKYLKTRFNNLNQINSNQQLEFKINGKRQFLQLLPYQDVLGLNLIVVVVVPEADFMEQINAHTRTTILLCLAALILAVIGGVFTTRWVVRPLLYLNESAKGLATGDWDKTVKIERSDEVGQLAASFNKMAEQLQAFFTALESQNAEMKSLNDALSASEIRLKQFLEAIPVGVFVVDGRGKPFYVNSRAQQLFGQGIVANAKAEQLPRVYRTYLAGKNCIYPQDRDPILQALQGESVRVDDMEIRRTNIRIPIEVWGRPIYDDQGKIAYAIAAFTDITERKQAEAERHKLIQELCELNGNLEVALDAELNLIKAATRFVPNQFLSLLGHQSLVDVQLGDQVQQEMSVLFSDIRDFTALSEAMTPQETFEFINAYLERMEPAIAEHNGFIDKYMGDGIMALFSGGADDAVKAGIAMLQSLAEYNQYRANFGLIPIQIGIGINTGSLMLGTVGGKNRMDGTVISDAVNLASRVEGLTKLYGVSMLITEKTFLELNEPIYAIRPIERVKVKGKSKLVMVYEVFEADPPEVKEGKLATSHIFIAALYQYKLNNFREAGKLFADCLRQNPKDSVAKIYLHRCHENDRILINNPQIFSYSAR